VGAPPRLSIVLSTLGNYPVLKRVLDGYDRQTAPAGSFELLVVADRAEPDLDAVDAAIGERSYPVRRLVGVVPGLSANRNTGWRAARAPVVLFTDNDTIPVRRLVAEHLGLHDRHPEERVAVVGHVRWAKGLRVTPFMKWLDDGVQFHFGSLSGDEASWAHLYGANSSIKRSFLERVGGYDEERLPYLYEDIDWGYRAREHGVRVLYNRRAIVDHWRPMTLEVYRSRAPQLAATEWQFCQMHPDVPPWFFQKFSDAVARPQARGRGARMARFVPHWVPWLGGRVWSNADVYWRQQIAPHFLEAWEAAVAGSPVSVQPDVEALLAERSASSAGS
jgi:cellulose synthase/poly-beta-1,6-N-acetylglucosamine synthase-like glycosyltransferase